MPKALKLSLSGIAKQIDASVKALNDAKTETRNPKAKKELVVKIRNLKRAKKDVQELCRGLNIIVPLR